MHAKCPEVDMQTHLGVGMVVFFENMIGWSVYHSIYELLLYIFRMIHMEIWCADSFYGKYAVTIAAEERIVAGTVDVEVVAIEECTSGYFSAYIWWMNGAF